RHLPDVLTGLDQQRNHGAAEGMGSGPREACPVQDRTQGTLYGGSVTLALRIPRRGEQVATGAESRGALCQALSEPHRHFWGAVAVLCRGITLALGVGHLHLPR